VPKHPAEGLEDAALEVLIVLLVEDLEEVVDAKRHSDHLLRVAPEVGREPVVLGVVRHHRRQAKLTQQVHPLEEILALEKMIVLAIDFLRPWRARGT